MTEEDALRAKWYSAIAALLARAPSAELLAELGRMEGDDTPFGQAVGALAAAARGSDATAAGREYDALFIGMTQGELTPYASYYLTGFLHEKPLARLRQDLAKLGVAKDESVVEPEDHIAMLLETMAGLITGAYGDALSIDDQRAFFDAHIGSWAPKFFSDLEAAEYAVLYMPVGALGRLLVAIEKDGFAMV